MKLSITVNEGTPDPQFNLDPKPPGPPQETYPTGIYDYQRNKKVIITAPPVLTEGRQGCKFDHWEGDAEGTDTSVTITMDSDKAIVACYTELEPLPIPPPKPPPVMPPPYRPPVMPPPIK